MKEAEFLALARRFDPHGEALVQNAGEARRRGAHTASPKALTVQCKVRVPRLA